MIYYNIISLLFVPWFLNSHFDFIRVQSRVSKVAVDGSFYYKASKVVYHIIHRISYYCIQQPNFKSIRNWVNFVYLFNLNGRLRIKYLFRLEDLITDETIINVKFVSFITFASCVADEKRLFQVLIHVSVLPPYHIVLKSFSYYSVK